MTSIESGAEMAVDLVHGDTEDDDFYRWYGDINGDRLVDATELSAFLASFRQSQGSPVYNEDFDIDGGGIVDALDLSSFLQRFRRRLDFTA